MEQYADFWAAGQSPLVAVALRVMSSIPLHALAGLLAWRHAADLTDLRLLALNDVTRALLRQGAGGKDPEAHCEDPGKSQLAIECHGAPQ